MLDLAHRYAAMTGHEPYIFRGSSPGSAALDIILVGVTIELSVDMGILITGGAGYIGSVTTEFLRARGEQVVVLDNFSRGIAMRSRLRFPSTKVTLAIANWSRAS